MRLRPGALAANRRRGAGPPPGVGAHRYWRVRFNSASEGETTVVLSQLYLYTNPYGPAELTVPTGANTLSFNTAAALVGASTWSFTNTQTQYWQSTSGFPKSITWDFGSGNEKEIGAAEMYRAPLTVASGPRLPGSWDVQYSDDNSTWTTAWSESRTTAQWAATDQNLLGHMSLSDVYAGPSDGVLSNQPAAPDYVLFPANSFSDASVTPAADNDPVEQITNLGSAGGVFNQSTLARRPIFKTGGRNGLPYLRFTKVDEQYFDNLPITQPSGVSNYTPMCIMSITDNMVPGSGEFAPLLGPGKFAYYFLEPANAQIHAQKAAWRHQNLDTVNENVITTRTSGTNRLHTRVGLNEVTYQSSATNNVSLAQSAAELFRHTGLGNPYLEGDVYGLVLWHNTIVRVPELNRVQRAMLRMMGRI